MRHALFAIVVACVPSVAVAEGTEETGSILDRLYLGTDIGVSILPDVKTRAIAAAPGSFGLSQLDIDVDAGVDWSIELGLRLVVGLGDPPLYDADPEIEYLLKPGSYRRFGNSVTVNSAGMRSPESVLAPIKVGERRVLVVGDSIVNGGSLTDDADLATYRLSGLLSHGGSISVCNISAGSWGPANWLAYLHQRGTFSASFAVLVLNDGDAIDVPTFATLGPEHPTSRPCLAISEAFVNYVPRYLPLFRSPAQTDPPFESVQKDPLDDISEAVHLLRDAGISVCAVLALGEAEMASGPGSGLKAVSKRLQDLQVPMVDFADALKESPSAGHRLFRDGVHLTPEGQRFLADCCVRALAKSGFFDSRPSSGGAH